MFTFRFTFWGRGGGCAADALGGGDAILAYSYVFIFRLGAGLKMRRGLLSFFGDRCRWWFTFRFAFFYGLLAGRLRFYHGLLIGLPDLMLNIHVWCGGYA